MSDKVIPLRTYFLIFISLMVLTVITVWVAFIDLGSLNVFVALSIAVLKATLVILFFMHVKYSSSLVRIYAAAGFVWLLIMFAFTLSDYISRGWLFIPPGWNTT